MDSAPVTIAETLAGLDLPLSAELERLTVGLEGRDIWRYASRLLTRSMARDLWMEWNPAASRRVDDPGFLGHFRDLLASGLALGYRLGRFRELAARLPDPSAGARNWISLFEDVVAGDDCGTIRLGLSREQYQAFRSSNRQSAEGTQSWDQMLSMMSDGLFYELGLVTRGPEIVVDDALTAPALRCEWNDLRRPSEQGLNEQTVLVGDTVERLRLLDINGVAAVNPANGKDCAIIDKAYQAIAEEAGLQTWDSRGFAILALSAAIRNAAAALINRSLYDLYLFRLREFSPDLVSAVEKTTDGDFVVQILRGLLAEEISIRDLSGILQAILELRSTIDVRLSKYIVFVPPTGGVFAADRPHTLSELLPADYVEVVRWSHKRYISHKYTRGQNTLIVYLVDPKAEEVLSSADEIEPAVERAIVDAVRTEVGSHAPGPNSPVILTSATVRHRLRTLLAPEFARLAVVSYQELSPDMNIQPIARISPEL